jgi:hypothetical protein
VILAHVVGVPVEESVLALAPVAAAILSGAGVIARSKLAAIVGWLRRHHAMDVPLDARLSAGDRVGRRVHSSRGTTRAAETSSPERVSG